MRRRAADPAPIDRSLKALIRWFPPVFFRLAGEPVDPALIRTEDELRELAPLLVLCEDTPTEQTLREERRLILEAPVSSPERADLLAVAVTVGSRFFARDLLFALFREELEELGL